MKEDNLFKPPSTKLDDMQIDTYTDHPAYQEPVKRSRFHNTARKAFGVILIALAIFLFTIAGMWLLLTFYAFFSDTYSVRGMEIGAGFWLTQLFRIFIPGLLGLGLFKYGRHLTRPKSREYV